MKSNDKNEDINKEMKKVGFIFTPQFSVKPFWFGLIATAVFVLLYYFFRFLSVGDSFICLLFAGISFYIACNGYKKSFLMLSRLKRKKVTNKNFKEIIIYYHDGYFSEHGFDIYKFSDDNNFNNFLDIFLNVKNVFESKILAIATPTKEITNVIDIKNKEILKSISYHEKRIKKANNVMEKNNKTKKWLFVNQN